MDNWTHALALVVFISVYILALVLFFKYFRDSFEEKIEYIGALLSSAISIFFMSVFIWFGGFSVIGAYYFVGGTIIALLFLIQHFSIHKAIMAFITKKMPFFTSEANDLIAHSLMEKHKKYLITYSSLFLSLAAEYIIYHKTPEFSMLLVMALTLALLALNFANQQILYYRLKHGLYGTCHSEAKEIIAYIIEQMNDKNNSGGGLPKLVFTQEELDECLQVNGGEEYAG